MQSNRRAGRARGLGMGVLCAVLLAACGGGGDGGGTPINNGGGAASSQYARQCAAPRPAGTVDAFGRPYNDLPGSLDREKRWVSAWNDETYLWYREVFDRGPAAFTDPVSYFDSLRTTATTPSGAPKDQFHYTYDTAAWQALSVGGQSFGYGFNISLISASPPRQAVVAYTDPGTPAASANIGRGAQILMVDGVDLVNDGTQAGVNVLNAGLFPSAAGNHTFRILDAGSNTPRNVTLAAGSLALVPVQNVRTLPAPYQSVGYVQFNDHIATAEAQLVSAIQQLAAAQATDLVIDLRYNGGGYLDISSELSYMVAGAARTQGKVYEELRFNDKNPFGLSTAERTTPFHSTTQGFSLAAGSALPSLNLARVYLLVGGDTCSASEAIINGLRGAGVAVVLIGNTTCGKPYGFFPQDNCGTTYFTIQFEGVNHLGQGGYSDGFSPNCTVADDFSHALGDPAEALLSTALGHRATGSCVRALGSGRMTAQSASDVPAARGRLLRSVLRENRVYRDR
jgi:carboxyl-terminal processing protease